MTDDTRQVKTSEERWMNLNEFREVGYVQEVNRQVLHPAGLALAWSPGWTWEQFDRAWDAGRMGTDDTDAIRAAWRGVQAIGLDRPFLVGVIDYRKDPEGMIFSDLSDPADAERAARVLAEQERHAVARLNLFEPAPQSNRAVIQPIGDKRP